METGTENPPSEDGSKPRLSVGLAAGLALFAVALAIRLVHVLPLGDLESASLPPRFPIEDDLEYHTQARRWVSEPGFALSTWRPPGYVLFCSLFYGFDPSEGYRWVRVAQAFLGAGSCVLILILGWRLHSLALGLLAGLLYALQLEAVVYTGRIMRETLFPFLWLSFATLTLAPSGPLTWTRSAALGAVGVGVCFVRPEGILLLLAHALWDLRRHRAEWKRELPRLALAFAVLVPFLVANGLRVRAQEGTFAPFGLDGPGLLYVGNNPKTGQWDYFHEDPRTTLPELIGKPRAEQNRILLRLTQEYIRENPTGFLRGLVYKTKVLLFGTYKYWQESRWTLGEDLLVYLPPLTRMPLVGYGFLLLAGIYGWLHRPKTPGWGLIWLWIGTYLAVMILVASFSRGRVSLLPFLALLAARGCMAWWDPFQAAFRDRCGWSNALRNLAGGVVVLALAWNSRWVTDLLDWNPPQVEAALNEGAERGRTLKLRTEVGARVETWMEGKKLKAEVIESWDGRRELTLPPPMLAAGDIEVRVLDHAGNPTSLTFEGLNLATLDRDLRLEAVRIRARDPGVVEREHQGRAALEFQKSGGIRFRIQVPAPGVFRFSLLADGTPAHGSGPKARVTLDRNPAPILDINPGSWAAYDLNLELAAGIHMLGIEFVNDDAVVDTEGRILEDRNLMIAEVMIRRVR
ncbi:MAG: hypothetical protein HUU16_18220 [Candidatus Omnitrophica bacterium]|nr:hypothetical protein [Candidatus Omnitrophota bacterium]